MTDDHLPNADSVVESEGGSLPAPSATGMLRPNFLWRFLRVPFWIFCKTWIRLDVAGREHLRDDCGGVLLINHQSFLDPLLVGVLLRRPVSFLARDNLFNVPVIGWILKNTYVMPISREAARGGSIRAAVERLSQGFLVGMFPEGTRSSGLTVGTFRPGFLAIVRRTTQPIYPVGIAGADRILPRGSWFLRPGRVQVVIGAPLTQEAAAVLRDATLRDADQAETIRLRVTTCVEQAAAKLSAR